MFDQGVGRLVVVNGDQSIALAAVISGGVVGLSGVIATAFSAMRDRSHERSLARTEREQVRLAEAYIGGLEVVEKVGYWAQNVRPINETVPPMPDPPLPDLEEQVAAWARIDAYGSAHIKKLMDEWRTTVAAVRRAHKLVGLRQAQADRYNGQPVMGSRDFMDFMTPWAELEDTLRPAEKESRRMLTVWISSELKS